MTPPFNQDFAMPENDPQPPKHLRAPTRRWWASVVADFDLDESLLKLLTLAAEAWDRGAEAREELAKHGLTFVDRFKAPHARPEVAIERDSAIRFARLMRELALDVSDPADDVRPPAIRGNSALKVAGE